MRVLIATVTAGAGHLQAAAALEEAWREARPRDQLQKVDVLDYTSRLNKKLYSEAYIKVVEHAPELYAMVFKHTDDHERLEKLSRLRQNLARLSYSRYVEFLNEFKPQILLAPHFLPLQILSALRRKGKAPPLFSASVVTDFEAHAFWIESSTDAYFVAAEETRASLISRGVDGGKITVSGIPVAKRFREKPDPGVIRKKHGLRDDLVTLLVLSGGFGMGPVGEILAEIDKLEMPLQTVVITGRNEELRRDIATRDRRHPTRVLGFTREMHEFMAASDLIISKPGGLTTSEALALGKPLAIVNPIPGQETANSDFLLEKGAAVKVNRVSDLAYKLKQTLEPGRLAKLSAAARDLGRPNAAEIIRDKVIQFAGA
jgi:processive 1,2-diacylglycerol beta-glucosyltransferase